MVLFYYRTQHKEGQAEVVHGHDCRYLILCCVLRLFLFPYQEERFEAILFSMCVLSLCFLLYPACSRMGKRFQENQSTAGCWRIISPGLEVFLNFLTSHSPLYGGGAVSVSLHQVVFALQQ